MGDVCFIIGSVDESTVTEAVTTHYEFNGYATYQIDEFSKFYVNTESGNGSSNNPLVLAFASDTTSDTASIGVVHYERIFYLDNGAEFGFNVGFGSDPSWYHEIASNYKGFTDRVSYMGTYESQARSQGSDVAAYYSTDNMNVSFGFTSSDTSNGIFTKQSDDVIALLLSYNDETMPYGFSLGYAHHDLSTGDYDATGLNAYYQFNWGSINAGYEYECDSNNKDHHGYGFGVQFDEVGPGVMGFGLASQDNYKDTEEELIQYEVYYSFEFIPGIFITPGVWIKENSGNTEDETGIAVKTLFSF